MTDIEFLGRSPQSLILLAAGVLAIALLAVLGYALGNRVLVVLEAQPALQGWKAAISSLRKSLRRSVMLLASLLALCYVGWGFWLLFRGEELSDGLRRLAGQLPQDYWQRVPAAALKIVALVVIVKGLSALLLRLLAGLQKRALNFKGLQANDENIERFFLSLRKLVVRGSWLSVVVLSALLLGLTGPGLSVLIVGLQIFFIISGGLIVWQAVDAIVATVDALSEKYAESKELSRYYDHLKPLVPLLRRTLEYLIYLTVVSLAILQIEPIAPLAGWGSRLMKILGLFFLTRVIIEVAKLLVEEVLTSGRLGAKQRQRRLTLVPLVRSFIQYAVYSVFLLMTLKEFGVDPMPFLAGAGIVGLAIGFGAQSLVQDMVSGLFILIEEYYLVGDYIKACDAQGVVESIDLRTTRIRDGEGRHHILRNGEIENVVNYSKEYTQAVVEVGVAYSSNLAKVTEVLEAVGQEIMASRSDVLLGTVVEGVEVFAESSLILRTATRVQPGCHRPVERELRRRFKEAFEQNDIEIAPTVSLESMPFPSH